MENLAQATSNTIEFWQERALKAEKLLEDALREITYLKAQVRLLTAKRFSSSSEKTSHIDQQKLEFVFNEVEATAEPSEPEPELVTVSEHKRAKSKGRKNLSLEGLPENVIEYRLSEEEEVCPCGNRRHVIGKEVSKELVVIPAKFYVNVHVQYVYACRSCETNPDSGQPAVVTAPKPKSAFPGSFASPSVVADVIEQKYVMGVPLYRQEQQWERRGISLSRQNMANWVMRAAENWFEPIYEKMKATLLGQDIIYADETTVQVLQEEGRKAESKSYMWLYRSGRYGPGIVLYEYQPSRAGEHPRQFLQGFKGYLLTDGYSGYNNLPGVTNVGCWAHARRGFSDASIAGGGKKKKPKALEGLEFCNRLFNIEKELRELTPEERYKERLLRSKPVLEEFSAWLHATKDVCLPQSHLGKAVQYCLNQWEALNGFLLDGRLEIDNNRSERSIKPFVISRKNFLFCNTPRGARASAITFSIVESAKENGLKPYEYIKYLLEQLPNATSSDLERFMPWSPEIPDYCRTQKKN